MLKSDDSTPQATPSLPPVPVATSHTEMRRLPAPERHPSVTPLDMRQARFATALRGFSRTEVQSFLEEAAAGYDAVLRENDRLRQQIAGLEASIVEYRATEGTLKTTLVTAQKMADDIRETGRQEAQRLTTEAEARVELMMQKAMARMEDLQREIDGLRLKRREVQTNVETCVSALQNTIEFIRDQEQRERETRVVQHRPRVEAAAG